MGQQHYLVAIVGAGPAGAACANALLLGGRDGVVLIDAQTFPRDKSCGDGLGPGIIPALDELGLASLLEGRKRVTRMSMSSPHGGRMQLDTSQRTRRSPLGFVIPRLEFDHELVKAAVQRGAADMTGWALERAEHAGGRWTLALTRASTGETRQVTADVLVGADGARSKVRRLLGQPLNDDQHTSIAVRLYASVDPQAPAYQQLDVVEGLPIPGYGWAFYDGAGRVNVGVGADVVAYQAWKLHLNEMLALYQRALGGTLDYDARSRSASILPLASQMPALVVPDKTAALIGDAASMINPLTGEGIFYGMYAGIQLGRRIGDASRRGEALTRALTAYQRDFRQAFGAHFRGNWMMRKMLERPRLLDIMVRACVRNDELTYDYIDYMMGNDEGISRKPILGLALRTLVS